MRAPTHPTYPQSGQPGFAWTVPPRVGLAYTTPHSRHRTLSSTVNLGVSPESAFTWEKNPLFAETCVSLVAEGATGPAMRRILHFRDLVFCSGRALRGAGLLHVARDLSHQLVLARERTLVA